MNPGAEDVVRAASALSSRLPWPLAVLARLAYNYRWAWLPGGPDVFRDIDPDRWRACGGNPVRLLQETSAEALLRAAGDASLVGRAEQLELALLADLARPAATGAATEDRPIAFFCAEYGVHASLPIYAGGLGALAGDILKEASDRALPFVAVGLMYRHGYFRQRIDHSGWQQEFWVPTDPERSPAVLVTTGEDRTPLRITVPIGTDRGRRPVVARRRRARAAAAARHRPARERARRALDHGAAVRQRPQHPPGAVRAAGRRRRRRAARARDRARDRAHERGPRGVRGGRDGAARRSRRAQDFATAFEEVRRRTVFTTHTPVPAGNDTYGADEVRHALAPLAASLGTSADELIRRGRTRPDDEHEGFGVTQFALRASRAANGVSRRHGAVAREMWHALWPDRADRGGADQPRHQRRPRSLVGRRADARAARPPSRRGLGLRTADPATFAAVDAIPAAELWAVRCTQRRLLVEYVRDRSQLYRIARGDPRDYVEAAAKAFDPDVLTLGFARRMATYKRMHLLLHDVQRSIALLRGERPVQLLIAGKAHPRDDDGKRLVQQLFGVRSEQRAFERVVFLEDYDLGVASRLVRGCDAWLNVPRPPLEASGTSGMKSAVNGGLQISVLDGWWAEGYDGTNGWALPGEADDDHHAQDARHAEELYRLLEREVVPEFYARDEAGIPQAWIERVKRSMRTLIPAFSATRMLAEYESRVYREA